MPLNTAAPGSNAASKTRCLIVFVCEFEIQFVISNRSKVPTARPGEWDTAGQASSGAPVAMAPPSPTWVATNSPWFWLLMFSGMSLVALQIVDRKYGPRQAQIERQFQGRQYQQRHPRRPAGAETQPGIAETEAPPAEDQPKFSQADDTLITLWPLRAMALVAMLAAVIGLQYERRRAKHLVAGASA